jgi:hypothetical protein
MGHDGTGGDDRIRSDGHTGQDRGGGPDPDVPLHRDRLHGEELPPLVGLDGVTGRDQVDLVGDQDVVCDVDGSVTGEDALVTDADGPADRDGQPVVGGEGGVRWNESSTGLPINSSNTSRIGSGSSQR